jgi:hypothetical protein
VAEELNTRFHLRVTHRLEQTQGTHHVVVVIGQRLLDRFAHRLEAGEVDDRLGAAGFQCRGQCGTVAHVAPDQCRGTAGNAPDAGQAFRMAVAEVVEDGNLMSCGQQFTQV